MKKFEIELVGTHPLLMHNSRLSNPLDPAAKALKEITSKRSKTDADHLETARREFLGGMYYDSEIGIYLPGDNLHKCLRDAGAKSRRGTKIKEGLIITTDYAPLAFNGPSDPVKLWEDENFRSLASVKVGTSRIMRCRPMFRQWAVRFEGLLEEEILNLSDVSEIAQVAGAIIGLGDWRPRYGRFVATVRAL